MSYRLNFLDLVALTTLVQRVQHNELPRSPSMSLVPKYSPQDPDLK
jgi:hypothetical protein